MLVGSGVKLAVGVEVGVGSGVAVSIGVEVGLQVRVPVATSVGGTVVPVGASAPEVRVAVGPGVLVAHPANRATIMMIAAIVLFIGNFFLGRGSFPGPVFPSIPFGPLVRPGNRERAKLSDGAKDLCSIQAQDKLHIPCEHDRQPTSHLYC